MWESAFRAGKDMHTLWRNTNRPGEIYVSDRSGPNPHATEDGPTRVDFSRALLLGSRYHSVPVIVERTEHLNKGKHTQWVGIDTPIARWLIENTPIKVEIDERLQEMQKVLDLVRLRDGNPVQDLLGIISRLRDEGGLTWRDPADLDRYLAIRAKEGQPA